MKTPRFVRPLRAARGFSLVELMVGVAISLVVTLVILNVLSASEARKRTMTSVNDVNQSGAYITYVLDRAIRSAGSSFVNVSADAYGCPLNVGRAGTTIVPIATLPVPFAGVSGALRLAPVVIAQGQSASGSDVLIVMAGAGGFGEARISVLGPLGTGVRLPNTIGIRQGELLLLGNQPAGQCLVSQVDASYTGPADDQAVPMGGTYYAATAGGANLTTMIGGSAPYVTSLGNVSGTPPQNPPVFRLYGVGGNQTLFAYDPLRMDGSNASTPVAEGVVEMRAVYGIDTDGDRDIDGWVEPAGPTWGAAGLLSAGAANLRSILAVRVALILRTTLLERDQVAPANITLFSDLPAAVHRVRAFTGTELNYRHRVIESTIPVRNNLLP